MTLKRNRISADLKYNTTSPALLIPKFTTGEHPSEPALRERFWKLPLFIAFALVIVYWLDDYFYLDLYRFGLLPRTLEGLFGIFITPFVHSSLSHLLNNLLPLFLLLLSINYFYSSISHKIILLGYIITGILVWIIAREHYHIGASGQVYAFASFVFFSGLIKGKVHLLAISLLVAFLYGGLFWGIFPIHPHISWESHLAGGFTGFILALYFRHHDPYYSSPVEGFSKKKPSFIKLFPEAPAEYETSISDVRYRHITYHYTKPQK
ncbi:MAG: rhomboid family intramembrane serine protease [Thermaurantimonas aggregans]|nr:rhomboid family intramembrane serine protease [Thermaurantimonas aggregans]